MNTHNFILEVSINPTHNIFLLINMQSNAQDVARGYGYIMGKKVYIKFFINHRGRNFYPSPHELPFSLTSFQNCLKYLQIDNLGDNSFVRHIDRAQRGS